jgi:hypothetical protein
MRLLDSVAPQKGLLGEKEGTDIDKSSSVLDTRSKLFAEVGTKLVKPCTPGVTSVLLKGVMHAVKKEVDVGWKGLSL